MDQPTQELHLCSADGASRLTPRPSGHSDRASDRAAGLALTIQIVANQSRR
jgi:hypothetical protein